MDKIFTISVRIPSDAGFVGRACKNTECEQYFKVSEESCNEIMYCPYCGDSFDSKELLTSEQSEHVTNVIQQKADEYAQEQLQDMLKSVFGSRSSKKSGFTYKAERIKRKTVLPSYRERKVDSEIKCPACESEFQVYGVFGFCPGCREENLIIYDANIKIITTEITSSSNPERQLRHAYNDLVSTFEQICTRKSLLVTDEKVNFQVLFEARKHFKKHASINILENIEKSQLLSLRKLFQKRHLYVHSDGVINEQYIKKIPEDFSLLGEKAVLSVTEFESSASAIRRAIGDLVKLLERKG